MSDYSNSDLLKCTNELHHALNEYASSLNDLNHTVDRNWKTNWMLVLIPVTMGLLEMGLFVGWIVYAAIH